MVISKLKEPYKNEKVFMVRAFELIENNQYNKFYLRKFIAQ